MADWSDYDDDAGGGVQFTLDMLNPFTMPSLYKFAKDPNSMTAVQVMYWPAVTTGAAYFASALAGSGNPYHWSMYRFMVADKYRMLATKLGQVGPRIFNSPAVLPLAFVAGTVAATNVIHSAQAEIVESMPEHEQSGMWRTFSSALSGGFNPNVQIY